MAKPTKVSRFFALMARLRYIQRWGLMRNTVPEDVQAHSAQVAMVAHGLALIAQQQLGRDVDANAVGMAALYHDAEEIFTGDIPTPVKKADPESEIVHQRIAQVARNSLLQQVPENLRASYEPLLQPDQEAYGSKLIKAADKVCAYLKCVEETKAGNGEFTQARQQIWQELQRLQAQLPELVLFLELYLEAFELSLDQLHS